MQNLSEFLEQSKAQNFSIQAQKVILRKYLLAKRQKEYYNSNIFAWGPKQYLQAIKIIQTNKILNLQQDYLISSFFPISYELNLNFYAQRHWLFPKISQNNELLWFRYDDDILNLKPNRYGILEKPNDYCFKYDINSLPMLCFMPGLAASKDGYRLGYGKGFYDKFLSRNKSKVTSILCLPSENFFFDQLPFDIHDQKVDFIIY